MVQTRLAATQGSRQVSAAADPLPDDLIDALDHRPPARRCTLE